MTILSSKTASIVINNTQYKDQKESVKMIYISHYKDQYKALCGSRYFPMKILNVYL